MANLVTNGLIACGAQADLEAALSVFCDSDGVLILPLAREENGTYFPFRPERLIPEPASVAVTSDGQIVDLGLAVLSVSGPDYLRLKQDRDPFLSAMPVEFQQTAQSLLLKTGLFGLAGKALVEKAETVMPGCVAAGHAAIRAFNETGEFGWYDWRKRHWGVRAFGETVSVSQDEDMSVLIRFDSVNECYADCP